MRRGAVCAPMMTLCLLLAACGAGGTQSKGSEELALDIRAEYIGMESCKARMDMTADYGERVYDYTVDMSYEQGGETVLTVVAPEEIAGVTARLSDGKGSLEYDGVSLETGPLDVDGLSPVGAVPVFLDYASKGFIAECGAETLEETECLRVCYRDPEAKPGTGTEGVLWFNAETHAMVQGEILVDGYRVISCTFSAFEMKMAPAQAETGANTEGAAPEAAQPEEG